VPSEYLDYYSRVAGRMLPFLDGRQVAIEQRFPGSNRLIYRRHTGEKGDDTWIRITNRDELLEWARRYAVAFHAHVLSEDRGAWFVIDIDSRALPLEIARIAAEHAADVLIDQGLAPLITFSGSDGFHLMWEVTHLGGLDSAELWEIERAVVRAVACEVEQRLWNDPRSRPIQEAVGVGKQLTTTANADRENANALLFDEYILKENANFRVPYSVHPRTGLVAVPLDRQRLVTFRSEDASPEAVGAGWPEVPFPVHTIEQVQRALELWRGDGC
jgi:hypothetical protein